MIIHSVKLSVFKLKTIKINNYPKSKSTVTQDQLRKFIDGSVSCSKIFQYLVKQNKKFKRTIGDLSISQYWLYKKRL